MNTQEDITSQTPNEFRKTSMNQKEEETLYSESIGPYSLSIMDVANSVKSLDESKRLTKELMEKLAVSSAPNDKQLLIRAAKEVRETLKVKLDIAKFAHVVGSSKRTKEPQKETA